MYSIKLESYPNNEVRVSFFPLPSPPPPRPIAIASPSPDDDPAKVILPPSDDVHSDDDDPCPPSPPLSLASNSKTERSTAGYGSLPSRPSKFGLNAKRQLIRSGAALETVAPPEECLFLTGTLPGSTEDAFRAIAAYSGYIVNSLKSWISTYATQKLDFYCWEYQRRGALHLHYCVHIPNSLGRDYIRDSFHQWWVEILHRVGERSNTDLFRKNSGHTWLTDTSKVRATAEVCRKSPARYLSKYLSKSAAPSRGSSRAFSPSRGWGTSRPLKALLDSLSSSCDLVTAGVHAIRRVWEDVSHICDSSDSVTYSYRHKFGIGETYVCYPKNKEERECLIIDLESLSMKKQTNSQSPELPPSRELKVLKVAQMRFLEQALQHLPSESTGLRNKLTVLLNTMHRIIPSSSEDVLNVLLYWGTVQWDIVSTCRFTPLWTASNVRDFDAWSETLERNIERVAHEGWS